MLENLDHIARLYFSFLIEAQIAVHLHMPRGNQLRTCDHDRSASSRLSARCKRQAAVLSRSKSGNVRPELPSAALTAGVAGMAVIIRGAAAGEVWREPDGGSDRFPGQRQILRLRFGRGQKNQVVRGDGVARRNRAIDDFLAAGQ